jgi:4-carboxymuconolactone decarboxylase
MRNGIGNRGGCHGLLVHSRGTQRAGDVDPRSRRDTAVSGVHPECRTGSRAIPPGPSRGQSVEESGTIAERPKPRHGCGLVARNQPLAMTDQFTLALDNGVRPGELSEVITHLAFYSGWGNAISAVAIAKDVFATRNIDAAQLPAASGELLPLDEAAEAQREARVAADFGAVSPGVVEYTRDLLFRELWLRPGLPPRDRSLVTVSALIASGQVEQIPYHLNRAMDNGLTQGEASEVLTHLAFYAGWPNVFSALPVAKSVFEQRSK